MQYFSTPDEPSDSPPPIMGTWRRLYIFVLVLHAFLLAAFYLFTRYFS